MDKGQSKCPLPKLGQKTGGGEEFISSTVMSKNLSGVPLILKSPKFRTEYLNLKGSIIQSQQVEC
jgi:hypothetical protein